jgi:hypothetical protein
MKPIIKSLLAFSILFISGCANPTVVQISPGIYELARADHGGIFGNKDALKSGVISDANAFAERQGKVAIPITAKEHPMGILADWASYEYTFKLVDKNDSETKTPMILTPAGPSINPEWRSLGGTDVIYTAVPVK